MRNNQPITQQEYPVRNDCAIISYTNSKGQITYVNDEFVEYAGFTREELIGKPHNIIRHPDMPQEAFRDFWATLKQGRAWQGMVKNRRKNGDHYWVKATATPMRDGGYMSVRLKATSAEIQQAEALYKRMREGSKDRFINGYHINGTFSFLKHKYQSLSLITNSLLPIVFLWVALLTNICIILYSSENTQQNKDLFSLAINLFISGGIAFIWQFLVMRYQTKRIKNLRRTTQEIGSGNLVVNSPLGKNNELGKVFNAIQIMRNRLFEIVFQINSAAADLNSAAKKMLTSSAETAKGAVEQSQASNSMAAALEQLSISVDQISISAESANAASAQAGMVSRAGAEAVHASTREIANLAKAIEGTAVKMHQLEDLSHNIGQIVSTIRDIADQTNLLALNAAIEAARAGEHGRGFAVVADEVRNLAERTANSTVEITTMVEQIQQRTEEAVVEMQASVTRVAEGVSQAENAGDSVAAIEGQAEKVLLSTNEIQAILAEQAIAAREVAETVEGIARLAENNSAQAHQSLVVLAQT